MRRLIVLCVVVSMVSAASANLLTNSDLESWTNGKPDSWQQGSATVLESTLLNGTSSAKLTAQTGVSSNDYYFRQIVAPPTPISDDFSVIFDIAFGAAGAGERSFNLNLQNVTAKAYTVLNLRYVDGILSAYDGSAWQSIDSGNLLSASDFSTSTINPYRMEIEGNLRQTYSLKITDLNTNTVIFDQSGLSHWQIPTASAINTINFDLSRGNNEILLDNFALVPEPATMVLLGIGSVLGLRRRK